MDHVWAVVFTSVAAVFALTVLGALFRRVNWLTTAADDTLLKLIVNVLAPALILHTIVGNPRLTSAANLLLPPMFGFVTTTIGFALAIVLARLAGRPAGLRSGPARRSFAVGVGIYNYGFIPLPLVEQLYDVGQTIRPTLGTLLIFNVGVELAMWTAGVAILHGRITRDSWRRIITPPLLAIVVAVVLNATGLSRYWPDFVRLGCDMLGRTLIPLSLLLTGAMIYDAWAASRLLAGIPTIAAASLLRLALVPAIMLAMAVWMPLAPELKRVLVVQAAMPAAIFPIVLTRLYHGDAATAVRVCIGTSLLSIVTLPLWLFAGLRWIGT